MHKKYNSISKIFLVILLFCSAKVFAAGRGAFVVIQNATEQIMNVEPTNTQCVSGVGKLKTKLQSGSAIKVYIEASNSGSCFFQTSDGNIKISNVNGSSAKINYRISAMDGSSASISNPNSIPDTYVRAKSINAASRTTIAGSTSQDLLIVNIMPNSTEYSSNWMSINQMKLASRKISDVVIPGTHDSLTNNLNTSQLCDSDPNATAAAKIPHFGISFAKSQSLSFNEQLEKGIRYFDVRLCRQYGSIYSSHSLISKSTFEEQTSNLSVFLQQHSEEVVILDLNHVYGFDETSFMAFLDELNQNYGKLIASYEDFSLDSTFSQLWLANKNLIIVLPSKYSYLRDLPNYAWAWPSSVISSPYKSKTYTNYNDIMKFVTEQLNNRSNNEFFVSQLQFSPDGDFITKNPSYGLEYMSYLYLNNTYSWLNSNLNKGLNIYIRDFSLGFDGVSVAVNALDAKK